MIFVKAGFVFKVQLPAPSTFLNRELGFSNDGRTIPSAMSDLCFICGKSLSESDTVNVVRGLQTLKTSIARNDKRVQYFKYHNFCECAY